MYEEYLVPEGDLFLLNIPEACELSESDRYGRSRDREQELQAIAKDIANRVRSSLQLQFHGSLVSFVLTT